MANNNRASISLDDAQQQGLVTGLSQFGSQPRREIDDFMVNDPDGFNLYILALARIMRDESKLGDGKQNKMNFFQVAGIHGLPQIDWDGVRVPNSPVHGSYCTHNSFLFPSWHRPYLAMFEQTLYWNIQHIAEEFDDPKYKAAAQRFRIPYWDWIKPRAKRNTSFPGQGSDGSKTVSFPYNYDLPQCLQLEELMIFQPGPDEKVLKPFTNPLLTYHFPDKNSVRPREWKVLDDDDPNDLNPSRRRTVRNPQGNAESDGYTAMNKTLNQIRESSVEQALDLIEKYDNYFDFAAERPRWRTGEDGNPIFDSNNNPVVDGPRGSLEDIHNTYHGVTGGDGHMSRVPVAAFDPVFWMHHCQIDRMLAVWQVVHADAKEAWLQDGATDVGQDVPLWPFRKDGKNSFWTSRSARDWHVFGYTYADVEGSKDEVLAKWDKSYRWSLQSNGQTDPPAWMRPIEVGRAQALQFKAARDDAGANVRTFNVALPRMADIAGAGQQEAQQVVRGTGRPDPTEAPADRSAEGDFETQSAEVPADATEDMIVQWYIDTQVPRDTFNGSFTIFFFLATPGAMSVHDAMPLTYATAPEMCGLTKIFTAPREVCDACNANADAGEVVTGTTPITPMLRDYINNGQLASLDEYDVKEFLKTRLYWRVVASNGKTHDPAGIQGLKIEVSSTIRQPGGVWEVFEYPEVTEGRGAVGDPVDV